jgi:hypothetical protein
VTVADVNEKRNQPLTVGALRRLLAEHHESDIVALDIDNLLYHPKVVATVTAIGHTVLIGKGDRFSV